MGKQGGEKKKKKLERRWGKGTISANNFKNPHDVECRSRKRGQETGRKARVVWRGDINDACVQESKYIYVCLEKSPLIPTSDFFRKAPAAPPKRLAMLINIFGYLQQKREKGGEGE